VHWLRPDWLHLLLLLLLLLTDHASKLELPAEVRLKPAAAAAHQAAASAQPHATAHVTVVTGSE
jgi:hypothetical protein